MHPPEVKLDGGPAGGVARAVQPVECGIVELGKSLARDGRRLLRSIDARPDVVVAVETVIVDHLVGDPAPVAAELKLGLGIHQTGRHGESAVGATHRHQRIFSWEGERIRN